MTGEMKQIKKYLKRISLMDSRIEAIKEHIEFLRESATRITPTLKDDVVSCSGTQDRVGDTASKIADLEKELEETKRAFIDEKAKIIRQLSLVEDMEYFQILNEHYINNKTFNIIAEEMHYSERWVCTLHGRALQAFKRVMEEEREL